MAKPQVKRPPIPRTVVETPTIADPAMSSVSLAPRLGIPLTTDKSAIDWATMRDSTREKLIALVTHDARFARQADASAPAVEIFSDRWCSTILDAAGKLEQSIITRVYHVTMDQAAVMIYSDADKRIITGPLQKVLNKYAGSWFSAYTDETALLLALGTVHIEKLQLLREVIEKSHVATPAPAPVVAGRFHREDEL